MKKLALFVSLAAILMVGCKKDNPVVPEIICDTDVVNVPVAGTEDEDIFVTFTSNVDWIASIKENAAWVSVSPASGISADGRVKLIVLPTEENNPREATLVLAAGTAVKEIKVVQAQVDAFSLAETSAEVGEEGGDVDIKAMTNIEWTVTIPSDCDWVSFGNVKAYLESVKTVKVEPYDELDGYREVVLTVAAGGQEFDFTISQYGPVSCLWSVDMSTVISRGDFYSKDYTLWDGSVEAEAFNTCVSVALWDNYLVVCAGDGSTPVLLDKATGEKMGTLSFGDVIPFYVTNDDAGNLVFCNRVGNWWVSQTDFSVWYMAPKATTPTLLVSTAAQGYEYGPSYIGAAIAVRGNVTDNAVIVAPWEGAGGYGENMVLAWNVQSGTVSPFIKLTISGFSGMEANFGEAGWWSGAPNNLPGFALLGSSLGDGAVMSVYPENVFYKVNADGSTTKLSDELFAGGAAWAHAPNAMDARVIGGKLYLAVTGGSFCGSAYEIAPVINVFDAATLGLVAEPAARNYVTVETGDLGGCSAAIKIEAAEGGMIVYHINNNCSVIEAIKVPLD